MKLVLGLFLACSLAGQTTPTTPTFDVATVKRAAPTGTGTGLEGLPQSVTDQVAFQGGPGTRTPNRIRYLGVTLKALLIRAFDLKPEQILGPSWLGREKYDVVANVPHGTSPEVLRLMLQELLKERFQIQLHNEQKRMSVYRLTTSKDGPKLQAAESVLAFGTDLDTVAAIQKSNAAKLKAMMAESAKRHVEGGAPRRSFQLPHATVAGFATTLSSYLDRPVKDETNLEGFYSFSLWWTPDAKVKSEGTEVLDAPLGPTIFTAVEEQLGLKLQPANEQLDVLVIDKATKIPTDN